MECKKISSFIAKLKIAYPRYFNELKNEDFIGLSNMLEEMLKDYKEETLNEVAKTIIKTKRYMPSISDILELCDNTKIQIRNEIIEKMIQEGYFKSPQEIDKAYIWLEEKIIPEWFRKDMMKYYNKMINNKSLIESVN